MPLSALLDLRGEILYWKPTTGGLNLGTLEEGTKERVVLLRPHHNVGFSLSARLTCLCLFGEMEYTHLDTLDRREIVKPITPPFGGTSPRVQARETFDLNVIEVRAGYFFFNQNRLKGALFVLVEAASTKDHSHISYLDLGTIDSKSRYRGIGPGLGIEGSFFFCEGLGAIARISTAILIGERDFHFRQLRRNRLYPSECALIPTLNGKLALIYRCNCLTAQLGFQVRHYPNAWVQGIFQNASLTPKLRDSTYGGAFAALEVHF